MQFGLLYFSSGEGAPRDRYRLVLQGARFADRHGFAGVWVPERHFTEVGCLFPNPSVVQAALARETSRVRLRAGSVVLPIHHPVRVAEEWSVVDNLSGGRVELSFASGWHPDDFLLAPEKYGERREEMYRSIDIIRHLWRGGTYCGVDGEGEEAEVRIYPTPVQKDLVFWITAAGNPKTFVRAGAMGAHLLTHLFHMGLEETAAQVAAYRRARAEAGHDPNTGRVAVMLHTFVGADLDTVRRAVRDPFCNYVKSSADLLKAIAASQGAHLDFKAMSERDKEFHVHRVFERLFNERVLFGTPESCLSWVEQLRAAGVDEIACQVDFGVPTDVVLENLPHLNRLRELCEGAAAGRTVAGAGGIPPGEDTPRADDLASVQQRCAEEVTEGEYYGELEKRGLRLPAHLRAVEALWRTGGEALARVRLPEALGYESDAYKIHPAYLDACLQVLLATVPGGPSAGTGTAFVPAGLRGLHSLGRPGRSAWCHAVLHSGGAAVEGDVRILDEEGRPVVEVRGLRLQRARVAAPPTWERHADWFYEVAWEELPLPELPEAPTEPGTWLIFADRQGVGQRLASLLEARGETCVLAAPVESQEAKGGEVWFCEGRSQEAATIVARCTGPDFTPLRGVVHLGSLEAAEPEDISPETLDAARRLGCDSIPPILRALSRISGSPAPRLWMVTAGCQSAGGPAALEVAQAPLWGLGRMVEVEHPALWGGLVDLDPLSAPAESASHLLAVISGADREDQVAFRKGLRFVARLRRKKEAPAAARPAEVRADGTYLITGGLGGIGLKLAEWLVHRGARRLVLLGRTPLPPRGAWETLDKSHPHAAAVAAIRQLEAEGAHVRLAVADVADEARMTALWGELRRGGWLPLRGAFHAAGLGLDRALADLDAATLATVLRPKVAGAWVLHRLSAGEPLDFFVLFSSVNSILATAGQGSYAAANAFLDALAHHRAAEGRPALCVNWGPWGEVGFGTTPQGVRQHALLALQGIGRIGVKQGLEILEVLTAQGPPQLGVIPIDWSKLLASHSRAAGRPLLAELVEEEQARRKAGPAAVKASRGFVAPRNELERALARMWQEGLNIEKVGVYDNFFELGGQSIQGAVLVNKLQERMGEVVHIVSLFDSPTIADLAVYLADNYPAGVARLLASEAKAEAPTPAARPAEPTGPRPPLDNARLDDFRKVVRSITARARPVPVGNPNPPAIFILSPPRCGSTLLRVMLAGHSRLFAPPELELLSFPTLADRKAAFAGRNSYRLQGTIRALMEIHGWEDERAAGMMEAWEAEGWSTQRFYRLLQEGIGERLLVDKTPSYGLDPVILERAEAYFEDPLYIHLTRHPYGMILSFEEAHMEALYAEVSHGLTPRELAEVNWTLTEHNVRAFLADVPARRQCHVRYEDLVTKPRETLEIICRMAGLAFEEAMTRPYQDKQRRMTDGLQMFGDVKFHKHTDIDPSLADRWARRYTEDFLGEPTWELAEPLGYVRGRRPVRAVPDSDPPFVPPLSRRGLGTSAAASIAEASDAEVDRLLQKLASEKKSP
jgi:natural product biosynthesis luciferase-like monooxygenase protein